ncbi:DUF1043 family protein [Proteobacteria bacterium 005FR1]|nr:DUF1043 family protein [Proteobacteria bacterium 005FR1]
MISTTSAVLIALFALAIGGVAGALLWRHLGPHQNRSRDLEKRLAEAERRLGDYQAEVTDHFVETSRRVNQLTRNYKEVHEYLASSAMRLTNPAVGQELRAAAQISWSDNQSNGETEEDRQEFVEEVSATDEHGYQQNDAEPGDGDAGVRKESR